MTTTPVPPAPDRTVHAPTGPAVAPTPEVGRPHRGGIVLGVLLVLAGAIWLGAELGVFDVGWRITVAGVVVAVGAAVAVLGWTGHPTGALTSVGWVLVAVLAITAAIGPPVVTGGIGERTERPAEVSQLAPRYELAMGTMVLDLSALQLPVGTTEVTAEVGMGDLRVRVPDDVTVVVEAEVGAGEARVLGEVRSGLGVAHEVTVREPGSEAVLALDLRVATGEIEVTR